MDEQPRLHDAAENLPDWLWEELMGLVVDFDHLPDRARYEAVKRNLSPRAHDHFSNLAARCVRERAEGQAEGLG